MYKRTKSYFLTIITAIVFFASISSSYAHRPLGTEDAGVGAMGEIVIELAYVQTDNDGEKQHDGAYAFVFGLGRAEIAVEGAYIKTPADEKGFGDLLFVAKILAFGADEKNGMFTIKAEALSTTGDEKKGLGGDDWEYAGSAVVSKTLGSMFKFHGQFGYNYVDDGSSDSNSYFYGAAFDLIGIADGLTLAAEVTGSYNDSENPAVLGGGVVLELSENVAADVLYGYGLNDDADDWMITAGMTFTF